MRMSRGCGIVTVTSPEISDILAGANLSLPRDSRVVNLIERLEQNFWRFRCFSSKLLFIMNQTNSACQSGSRGPGSLKL